MGESKADKRIILFQSWGFSSFPNLFCRFQSLEDEIETIRSLGPSATILQPQSPSFLPILVSLIFVSIVLIIFQLLCRFN